MLPKLAKIIVIEGPDRVGKETQTKMLVEYIRQRGYSVKHVEVPYNDNLSHKLVYSMLKGGAAKMYPTTFQLVQFANKFMFQVTRLPLYMLKYDYVVFDRWRLSSVVYGNATNVIPKITQITYDALKRADATIVLLGSSYSMNNVGDSYESDSKLQQDVKKEYKDWAEKNQKDTRIISSTGMRFEVHANIVDELKDMGVL